jgi:DNA-binding response OmpR family regulator
LDSPAGTIERSKLLRGIFGLTREPDVSASTVAVVEDDWLIAAQIKSWIASMGMTVVGPAHTLEEAEALVESAAFDAAVVDRNLGDKSADPLIAELGRRGVGVVVTTGCAIAPIDGSAAVVLKPFTKDELTSALHAAGASG